MQRLCEARQPSVTDITPSKGLPWQNGAYQQNLEQRTEVSLKTARRANCSALAAVSRLLLASDVKVSVVVSRYEGVR